MLIVLDSQLASPLNGVSATFTNVDTTISTGAATDASGIIDVQSLVAAGTYNVFLEKSRYREETVQITDISADYTVYIWPVMTFGL